MALTDVLFVDLGTEQLLVDGDVVVARGSLGLAPAGARVLECRGARVVPGSVNAHTHLYSGLAGLGMPAPARPPENFVQILERVWWRLDRALDRESLTRSAELYVAEALLHGTTALVDHHESPEFIRGSLDTLADAADALGCRLATGYGATDRNAGEAEGRAGLDECRRFAKTNRRARVKPLVALHASFTVGEATVRYAGKLARELSLPVHVHVAEDRADVSDAQTRGHPGPLERLLSLGALPPGSILAHGVHLERSQVEEATGRGLWLVQNPRSNAGNRVGFAHALGNDARVALGTDGYPADMRAEREALASEAARAGATLSDEVPASRIRASRALASELFGLRLSDAVEAGSTADLAIFDDGAAPRPRHVIVGGELVVHDFALARGDMAQIEARAREIAPRLWEKMTSYPEP